MSGSNSGTASGGIGFWSLLSVAFIVLKLCDVIAWSWWWVLSPLWIPWLVLAIIAVVALIVIAICAVVSAIFQ